MKKVALLFGVHMHQPVDNFDAAVDDAVKLCYAPFFETMAKYPDFKFSLHCSGWLLEKIRTEYPIVFENMQYLTQKGAIEWFSGGYYEPILTSIPSKDRVAQIQKLTQYIKKYFDVKPRGLWLTERVWDGTLIDDLNNCSIAYAMVDDYHFISNGYDKSKMDGYYTTESTTKELKLFPIAKPLRYALPFSKVEDSIKAVLAYSKRENGAAVFFDDAEKFGLWPETNKWVYKQKWLEQFVEAVLAQEQISTQHYGTYASQNKSLGLAYLDNCSYFEMGEWSLRLQDAKRLQALKEKLGESYIHNEGAALIKGGIWKNFFIKYHESNYLHKRILSLSKRQKKFDKKSLDLLYKAQTNDGFWHGVFGGFYLPSLRDNAYRYILEIEKRNLQHTKQTQLLDINKDGYEELKVLTEDLSMIISPKHGAQLVEFGSLTALFNWQNTIMRREEMYHHELLHKASKGETKKAIATIHERDVALDANFKSEFIYDWYQKNSFIEHFSLHPFTAENFKRLSFDECGDFCNSAFTVKNGAFIRKANLLIEDTCYSAKLRKKYSFKENALILKNKFKSDFEEPLFIAEEFNLHFAHPEKVTLNGQYLTEDFSIKASKKLIIVDDFTDKKLLIKSDKAWNIYAVFVKTVSKSEKGFDAITQQISLLFSRKFVKDIEFKLCIEVLDV